MTRRIKILVYLASLLCAATAAALSAVSDPLQGLNKHGQTKLSVLFWDIYRAELYTAAPTYQADAFPQALKLHYLRDIDADELLEHTEDEWQKLGVSAEQYASWLPELQTIWPDIKRGDELTLIVTSDGLGQFYFNNQAIGQLDDPLFGRQFLRIWLDPNSSYPKLRQQLIGQYQ